MWAKAIRKHHPEALIVLGGPHVPDRSEAFFRKHSFIDVLVHSEGERTFADLLNQHLMLEPDFELVPGITFRKEGGREVNTLPRERQVDIDAIPSPYLEGLYDNLLEEPYDFHALQETHRGCPYRCTFCDWGSAVFSKVRPFSDERLKAEVEWFAEHGIELLYNCDANFGIYSRDLDFVRFLAETKKRTNFPVKFRAAFAKKSGDRIFEIATILECADLSKGVTLSLQSLSDDTLEAVLRSNIKKDDFAAEIQRYQDAGIATYTELIIGLPSETYISFADGVTQVLKAGQHEGLFIFPCMVLPNSEVGDPDYQERYGIESRHLPLMLIHGTPPSDGHREFTDLVIATQAMPHEQWKKTFLFSWAVQAFHCLGLLRYPAIYFARRGRIGYQAFYEAFLDFARANPATILGEEFERIRLLLEDVLAGGVWDIVLPEMGNISWPPEEASFLRIMIERDRFYDEIQGFLDGLCENESERFAVESVLVYQRHMILGSETPTDYVFEMAHEIHSFFEEEDNVLSHPVRGKYRVAVNAGISFEGNLERYAREVVWYGRKGGQFKPKSVQVSKTNPD